MPELQPPTCATCGALIEAQEALVATAQARFHVACWRLVEAAARPQAGPAAAVALTPPSCGCY